MIWANFLHIYQPSNQTPAILDRVVNESYRKLLTGLLNHPQAKFTLNVNAVLTDLWVMYGYNDIIDSIKTLLSRGQLELTSSAKYHPFLPRLPESEVIRQVKLNDETNRNIYGELYKPQGFFPPEMAYTPQIGKVIKKLGFKWTILDEIAIDKPVDYTKTYISDGLVYFFRERKTSYQFLSAQIQSPDILLRELSGRNEKSFLLTAMDGETFGHHRPGLDEVLTNIYADSRFNKVKLSDLVDLFPNHENISPRPSNWAMTQKDLKNDLPFGRWDNPENKIHSLQWELVKIALSATHKNPGENTRSFMDEALHSDQFWWASAKPWWSLEMIERGAHDLVEVVNSSKASHEAKDKAQSLYYEIITTGFSWQRKGLIEKMSKEEDEELKVLFSSHKAITSEAEYTQLIASLRDQMKKAAEENFFLRAEELKQRINELEHERDHLPSQLRVNQ